MGGDVDNDLIIGYLLHGVVLKRQLLVYKLLDILVYLLGSLLVVIEENLVGMLDECRFHFLYFY